MDDIRRQDIKAFVREFMAPGRLLIAIFLCVCIGLVLGLDGAGSWFRAVALWGVVIGGAAGAAYNASIRHRFLNKRYEALWKGCQDRLERFNEVLKRVRKDQLADFREMPNTIERVAQSLYVALRRADTISNEVLKTERNLYSSPSAWSAMPTDAQSKELYRIADRNIAEYRQQFEGVMSGVERAEAQSAVFMTTLDTLRMKMLGYRLVGRSPEMPSHDFLEALSEAKLQLRAIDTALEELELGPYPQTIAVMPPEPETRDILANPPPLPLDAQTQIDRRVEG